jgi:hypothetical protein
MTRQKHTRAEKLEDASQLNPVFTAVDRNEANQIEIGPPSGGRETAVASATRK